MKSVYLASRYSRRDEMRCYANELRQMGLTVTSRWLDGTHELTDEGRSAEADERDRARFAQEDFDDLAAADVVISFTQPGGGGRGGRHVEYGMALALQKFCIVVGPAETVFHCLPQIQRFDSWDDLVRFQRWLVSLQRSR